MLTGDFLDAKDNDLNVPGNINLNEINRIVGDKKYELSNHLGNVLSVISDRKLPAQNVGRKWYGSSEEITEYWSPYNEAKLSYNNNYGIDVTCYDNESGAFGVYNLEADKIYNLQFLLDRDNFVASLWVYIEGANGETLYEAMVNNTQTVATQFTTDQDGEYKIYIFTRGDFRDVETFSIKNFRIADVSELAQTGNQVDFFGTFVSDVLSFNDYYPYGMLLPGRHGSVDSYRYRFNGMEADDELKGEGNSYDFGARMYDPRIGRWFAVDPDASKYPSWSPYSFSLNDPIRFNDPDGKNPGDVIAKSLKELKERQGYEIYIDRVTAETIIVKTEVIYDYNDISKNGNRVEYNLRKTNFKIDGQGNLKDVEITDNLVKAEVKETENLIGYFSLELIENQKGKTKQIEQLIPYDKKRIQEVSSDSPIVESFSNLISKQLEKVKTGSNGINDLPYRESTTEEKFKGTGNSILDIIELRFGPPTPYGTSILPRSENNGEIKLFIPKGEENKAIKLLNEESNKRKIDVQKS